MNRPKRLIWIVPHSAIVSAVAVALLCAAPVEAGWFGRGVGVAGAGYALEETLEENTGILGEILGAVIEGDGARVSELVGEIAKTPGKIVRRAFPVLEAPHVVAEKLKSAKRKIDRFVGGAGERIADARAALAIDRGGEGGGWNDAALLEGEPLSVPVGPQLAAPGPGYDSPAEVLAALRGEEAPRTPGETGGRPAATSRDFDDWVVSAQEARPHCYGIVDPETLPADCFGPVRAEAPAAKRAEDSSRAAGEGFDWASGEWTPEDTGWAGWDSTDPRYSDEDRDAARVGVFAARCWGVYGVSKGSGLHGLMKERMQRNECPSEETTEPAVSSGDAGSEYATALAGVLDENSTSPADGDYLAALNTLEAKEAERRRLEEEAHEPQARLEEEAREQARLVPECEEFRAAVSQFFKTQLNYSVADLDGKSYDRSTVQAAYKRLRNAAASVDVDFDSALDASMSVWNKEARGRSVVEIKGKLQTAVEASRAAFLNAGAACDLEAKAREQWIRLEEERRAQAKLAEAERRDRAERRHREEQRQLAEQRRFDALERQQQAEYRRQALQNINESLRSFAEQMNRTHGGGGASAGGGNFCNAYPDYPGCVDNR